MNIHRLIHKHYLSIFFFIILLVLTFSLLMERSNAWAAQDISNNSDNVEDMSGLMSAMNMYDLSPPKTAPDFTLMSLDGSKIQLSELRGNVVLLSFWATW
jgi:cytochrome oxidase Cu insertion factor (SCO1/SenC/PrrC family)